METLTRNGQADTDTATLSDEAVAKILAVQDADERRTFLTTPETERTQVRGIFDRATDRWVRYRVTLQFTGVVCGGTPNDPKIVEGWLKARAGITDEEEMAAAVGRTLAELGISLDTVRTPEALDAVVERISDEKHRCVFKRNSKGVIIEGRQVKAGLKEATNILYATLKKDERWTKTKKAPRSVVAERIFVAEEQINLLRDGQPIPQADDVLTVAGHISGPQGDRAALSRYEIVHQPQIVFHLLVSTDPRTGEEDPDLNAGRIGHILAHMERNGLGALRAQGAGQFKVVRLEKLVPKQRTTIEDVVADAVPTVEVDEWDSL